MSNHPIFSVEIPENWSQVTVDDIKSSEKGACVAGPFGSNISSKFFQKKGVPVIRGKNLSDKLIPFIEEGFAFISEQKAAQFKNQQVYSGDLVFTCWGTIGQVGQIPQKSKHPIYVISNKQLKLRVNESKCLSKFIYYYFANPKTVEYIKGLAIGAAVPGINLGILKSLPVVFPSLPIQNKIVSILSSYDDLIENNTRRIKILESMAQTLYQEWFVKFRFPGHKQVKMVESELGLIPEGWKLEKLRYHIKTQKGFAFKSKWYQDSGIPIVKVANFTDDSIDTKSLVCISEEIAEKHQKHKLFRDEIIIQTVGSWASNPKSVVGKVIRVPIDAENSLLNQNAVKIIPLESINKTFLYSLLKKEEFKSYIIGCGQGSASQASITLDSIKEFIFLLPSAELIKSFDNFTTPLWNLINTLRAKNIALYKTRDLLLPKLISGQIDVENLNIDTGEIAA